MADRIVAVNAYTSFTLLDGEAEGHGWTDEAPAVLNASTADGDVVLEMELDSTATDEVPAHADRVRLSPEEARELAADLESSADRAGD